MLIRLKGLRTNRHSFQHEAESALDWIQPPQIADLDPRLSATAVKPKTFHGSVQINPSTAKMRLVQVAEEIISVLAGDPNASLNITVEINAEFPSGASDQIKRAVSENARSPGFKSGTWE
jgi:uncharacterized protein